MKPTQHDSIPQITNSIAVDMPMIMTWKIFQKKEVKRIIITMDGTLSQDKNEELSEIGKLIKGRTIE